MVGAAVHKEKQYCFLLGCVIYCDNVISTYLFLRAGKDYMEVVVIKNIYKLPTNMRGFLHYVSCTFLKYQRYIHIHHQVLGNYYNIIYIYSH